MGRRFKCLIVLVLASFSLGLGACLLDCDAASDRCSEASADHCLITCACVTPTIVPVTLAEPAPELVLAWHLVEHPLRLPVIPSGIFQPPKA